MGKIIEVNNLVKSFGEVKAVKGIDLFVEEGKLFAFIRTEKWFICVNKVAMGKIKIVNGEVFLCYTLHMQVI